MIIIACADDRMGTMFNDRRQSRDRVLRDRILVAASGAKLWMNRYSAEQFSDCPDPRIIVDDGFLSAAERGDYCFVEGSDITPCLPRVEKIILYRWNRRYPSDRTFPTPSDNGWRLVRAESFPGSSHERITEEIYIP